jgi:hypothetical protein
VSIAWQESVAGGTEVCLPGQRLSLHCHGVGAWRGFATPAYFEGYL